MDHEPYIIHMLTLDVCYLHVYPVSILCVSPVFELKSSKECSMLGFGWPAPKINAL